MDPSGTNPLCLPLVIIDGPLIIGDGMCVVLVGATLWAGYMATGPTIDIDINTSNPGTRPTYPADGPIPAAVPEPIEEELLEEWFEVAEQAWENWKPTPTPNSTPEPTRVPTVIPIPTCTPEPRQVHISLGLTKAEGTGLGWFDAPKLLQPFTKKLNEKLNSQNIYVHSWGEWEGVMGISSNSFGQKFLAAAEMAKGIHFNLEDIEKINGFNQSSVNPLDPYHDFAERFGTKGTFQYTGSKDEYITADELYLIKNTGKWCGKTSFYTQGSISVDHESVSAWANICLRLSTK